MEEIRIRTNQPIALIDITDEINSYLSTQAFNSGFILINIPHTTAAITINENADSDVKKDIIMKINKIVSEDDEFSHFEGNSSAHIKASLMGFDVTLPFIDKQVKLGSWQGIYFCEFDGPRNRKVWVSTWKSC